MHTSSKLPIRTSPRGETASVSHCRNSFTLVCYIELEVLNILQHFEFVIDFVYCCVSAVTANLCRVRKVNV